MGSTSTRILPWLFIALVFFSGLPRNAGAQEATFPGDFPDQFDIIGFLVATEQYDKALRLSLHPLKLDSHPRDHLRESMLAASVYLARAIDLGDSSDIQQFLKESDYVYKTFMTRKPLHEGRVIPDKEFLVGTLKAAEAQYENDIMDRPLKAVGPASRSAEAMTLALQADSTLTGAKISLALYQFWRSHVLRSLAWTPFVTDRRAESVDTLYSIIKRNKYASVSAAIGLSWALIEEDKPLEAALLADSMQADLAIGEWKPQFKRSDPLLESLTNRQMEILYADNAPEVKVRGLLEPAGKGYYLAGRWELARARYDSLLTSLRAVSRQNPTREIGILHRLAHIAKEQEDWNAVADYAADALSLPLSDEQQDRKKDDLRRLKELQKQARLELKN